MLDQRSRERYFEDGFLVVPGYVGAAWLDRLRAVVAAKIEESRALSASDDQFDLAPDHSSGKPNIRHLRKAVDQHPELWEFAKDPTVVDLVADLLGPDVRFHSFAEMCGPAGTVVLIHCRVVHASAINNSARLRPVLLNVYSSADTRGRRRRPLTSSQPCYNVHTM